MANRITLLLMFSFITLAISAQTNICVDKDCLERNSAILSQSLINLKGENFVSKLLEDNTSFLMFCDVNSLGHVIRINKICSKKEIPMELKKEIESYLIVDSVSFYICYEKPSGFKKSDAIELIRKDLHAKNKTTYLINVGFPGNLMTLYKYERDRLENQGVTLSKYEYLKHQIDSFLHK